MLSCFQSAKAPAYSIKHVKCKTTSLSNNDWISCVRPIGRENGSRSMTSVFASCANKSSTATKSVSNAISVAAICSRVRHAVVPLMSRTGFIRQESIPLAHLGLIDNISSETALPDLASRHIDSTIIVCSLRFSYQGAGQKPRLGAVHKGTESRFLHRRNCGRVYVAARGFGRQPHA